MLLFSACTSGNAVSGVIRLHKYEDLSHFIGKRVTVVGEVTNTKMPQILGVDVDMPSKPIAGSSYQETIDLRGKMATATGILKQNVVKEVPPMAQSRGPGIFYELVDEKTGYLVAAQPVAK